MTKPLGFLLLTFLFNPPAEARDRLRDECVVKHVYCNANYISLMGERLGDVGPSTCEAELRACLGGLPDENAMVEPPATLLLPDEKVSAIAPADEDTLLAALILATAVPTEPEAVTAPLTQAPGPTAPTAAAAPNKESLKTPKELRQDQREERIDLRQAQRAQRQDLRAERKEARQDFREERRDARQEFRQERREDRRNLRDRLGK